MNTIRMIYTILLAASIPCAMILIICTYRRRAIPGTNYFILVMITAILYSVTYMGEINSNHMNTALLWFHLEHIPIPLIHYLWMVMSLEYARIPVKHLRLLKRVMLYHPILYFIVYYTNHWHQLYITEFKFMNNGHFPVIVTSKGPLFILMIGSGTIMSIIAMTYYIRGIIHSLRLQRYGYIIMIIASILPWFSVYMSAMDVGKLGIDYFPVVLIISGIIYIFGILKLQIFNTIPIAKEAVFRHAKEAILIIDRSNHIIDVNESFLSLYSELKNKNKKITLAAFIQQHHELEGLYHDKKMEFHRKIDGKVNFYSAEMIELIAEDGLIIGKILTINDITLYKNYQKKLEDIASRAIDKAETNEISFLQAQIKPHFINNTLSVIASMITRDPVQAKKLINNLGDYLANCYYIDSSSSFVSLENELEATETYIAIEKARFMERLNYHFICDDIPQISIPRLILQPLIENAIRHGILKKAEGGNVWLKITHDNQNVYFVIRDDGVGMTEDKCNTLLQNDGAVQGIGLMNIHKRLIKFYGEGLKMSSTVGEGTCVQFRIPYMF